jgi:hypothetical protein
LSGRGKPGAQDVALMVGQAAREGVTAPAVGDEVQIV